MSAVALNNRVTTYSDSDAIFASCTALPIQQTTLNCEEMAGIDGLCLWGTVLGEVHELISEWEDWLEDVNTVASLYYYGGVVIESVHPPEPGVEYPLIIPNKKFF